MIGPTGEEGLQEADVGRGAGEAELGVHQISEIVPVKGAKLVGPLPAEIQNYTTYSVGLGAKAQDGAAAKAFIDMLKSNDATAVLEAKGMERP